MHLRRSTFCLNFDKLSSSVDAWILSFWAHWRNSQLYNLSVKCLTSWKPEQALEGRRHISVNNHELSIVLSWGLFTKSYTQKKKQLKLNYYPPQLLAPYSVSVVKYCPMIFLAKTVVKKQRLSTINFLPMSRSESILPWVLVCKISFQSQTL